MSTLPASLLRPAPGGEIPDQPEPEQDTAPQAAKPAPVRRLAALAVNPAAGGTMARTAQAGYAGLRFICATIAGRFRDMTRREGGIPHAAYTGQPESLEALDKYRASRVWVAPADRGKGGFAETENAIYLATI